MTPLNSDARNNYTNLIFTGAGCDYYAEPPFVNWYDLYRACEPSQSNSTPQVTHKQVQFMKRFKKNPNITQNQEQQNAFNIDPSNPCCDNTALYNFLNDRNLWPHLNINSSFYTQDFKWLDCADVLTFTVTNGSYWIYKHLVNRGYKIYIYSGNTDLCVPVTGTRKWLSMLREELNLEMIEPMRPWYIPGNSTSEPQLGGFVEQYQGITFVEVQGVGHMVPEWARSAAWEMVYSLVNGKDLPKYEDFQKF
eukprot:TRINITY_DN864_c0_g1_i4.p1 TRINITY_DN864_c0_g1~~TRINITY_DN864_c0_g1_i4.p1  ORF type:complete len:250 (-),score=18.49 TRINITY_DN864_c0_g1_i4:111-860(-)